MTPASNQPTFYYDLGSPGCYLLAERVMSELVVVPEWEPILWSQVGGGDEHEPSPDPDLLGRLIEEAGLQPLRLPVAWPPQTERAMLAATYAKHIGRAVAFSLAAFRQAFAGGRDLSEESTILIAAAACEMHPAAVLKGMQLRSVGVALVKAGERARAAGVSSLPAIELEGELFEGERVLERAGEALAAMR